MIKNFRTHFVSGLLVLAPLFITVWVIRYLLRFVDVLIVNPVFRVLPLHMDATITVILAKIAIALLVVLFVTFIGFGAEKLLVRQAISGAEMLLKGIPVLNKVYGSVKDIAQAFFGDKKGVFKKVVFVEYPRKGIYSLGFITQDKRWEAHRATGKDIFTVFVPSPPNPATGFFIFVPKEEIIDTRLSIEDGIKLVISGGAAIPPMAAA